MKLYAQQGAAEGDKVKDGLREKIIDGIILSPRDVGLDAMRTKMVEYRTIDESCELYFDPQLYAAFSHSGEGNKLGHLMEDYSEYFRPCRRTQLTKESSIRELLDRTLSFQQSFGELSAAIAPNIIIPRAIDSIETAVSLNFIRLAKDRARQLNIQKPVYATLAISREALFKEKELIEFINELTALETPPDGFYVLISSRSQDARSDIFNADIIAAWMFLTYSLSINGFKVINGYSDLLAPFLSAALGSGAATGWWSNLRSFSISRFEPPTGRGRLPIQRYLSCALLNRITFTELDQLRNVPGILNNLPTDRLFKVDEEPVRNQEVLQSWEAIKHLITTVNGSNADPIASVEKCITMVKSAIAIYERIATRYALDQKSNADHLPAIQEGLQIFKKLAELDPG